MTRSLLKSLLIITKHQKLNEHNRRIEFVIPLVDLGPRWSSDFVGAMLSGNWVIAFSSDFRLLQMRAELQGLSGRR